MVMDISVRDNPQRSQFEAEVEGRLAVAEYRLREGVMTFTHTFVPEELRGRGIGSALAQAALDAARSRGLKVMPSCWFIADYIRNHPAYLDLLAARGP